MTPNLIDRIRTHIEGARAADGFVDANAVAGIIQMMYPSVERQTLIDAIIDETIAAHGSVYGEKPGMRDESWPDAPMRMVSVIDVRRRIGMRGGHCHNPHAANRAGKRQSEVQQDR